VHRADQLGDGDMNGRRARHAGDGRPIRLMHPNSRPPRGRVSRTHLLLARTRSLTCGRVPTSSLSVYAIHRVHLESRKASTTFALLTQQSCDGTLQGSSPGPCILDPRSGAELRFACESRSTTDPSAVVTGSPERSVVSGRDKHRRHAPPNCVELGEISVTAGRQARETPPAAD
jgi:hypothetical protein